MDPDTKASPVFENALATRPHGNEAQQSGSACTNTFLRDAVAATRMWSSAFAPLGVHHILRFFLNRSPMTDATADSARLVDMGSPAILAVVSNAVSESG
jgi:hypothetical protein